MKTTIVRFAPSPTGHLHIGGVRTALFNYFYARNQGGQYILRIEDTDVSRSSKHMADEIIQGLKWLGIHWDTGPVYQSDHFEEYKKAALQLLEEKTAYRCFCTPEQIETRKKESEKNGKAEQLYKYDRQCLQLSETGIQEKLEQKIPFVIRFKIPQGTTYFKDRLHKEMKIDNSELEDFVILKSDNSPTYHLSVVVDDSDMQITDVIRGDDHISNTFKQVLLFNAMGRKTPRYAHLPLILGPDKKKLSKRHGETSVLEFKKHGYLPEAIVNYLSQLSWIPADSKQLFSIDQLAKQFTLSKVSKSSPVFDYDKLRFINSRAIQQKDGKELYRLLKETHRFDREFPGVDEQEKIALIQLIKPRMKTLGEFQQKFHLYLNGQLDYSGPDFEKLTANYDIDTIKRNLKLLRAQLETVTAGGFDSETVEEALRQCADANGIKAADLIHPARYALTSETVSPPIFHLFEFFGKDESIRRIISLSDYLEEN